MTFEIFIVLDDGNDAVDEWDGDAVCTGVMADGRAALRRWRVLMGNFVLNIAATN